MGTTHVAKMGDRGRLVVPVEVRQRQGWSEETTLVFFESDSGVVVMTRDQLRGVITRGLAGPSLADELIGERRSEAAAAR